MSYFQGSWIKALKYTFPDVEFEDNKFDYTSGYIL